jgi:cellulose biosynthesis protein BcsQ
VKVVATYSIKGGVGKTAAAVNLSWLAARSGLRTLLWDLDPQGAATWLFRIKPRVKGGGKALVRRRRSAVDAIRATDFDRLELLPADFSYRHLDLVLDGTKRPLRGLRRVVIPLAAEYDLVLLDCAPGITLASESVFRAADALLVPIVPTTLSQRTLEQLSGFVEDHGVATELLPFFSMVDGRKRLHREVMASLAADHPTVLGGAIPASTDVERMGLHRAPVTVTAPRSRAAAAFETLWGEVGERLALET